MAGLTMCSLRSGVTIKSTERGDPAVRNDSFQVLVPFRNFSRTGYTISSAIVDKALELMGFPLKAVVNVFSSTIWMIAVDQPTVDFFVEVGVIPANASEQTMEVKDFYSRMIDYEPLSVIFATAVGWSFQKPVKQQMFINETYRTSQLTHQGLFLYMKANTAQTDSFILAARTDGEFFLTQRYKSDNYQRKGRQISEGYGPSEWEDALPHHEVQHLDALACLSE